MTQIRRRACLLVFVICACISSAAGQSLFLEANFWDGQYTALLENLSFEATSVNPNLGIFSTEYTVRARVLHVYHGDLSVGQEIEYLFYLDLGPREPHAVGEPYIFSFCRSSSGRLYMFRNFLFVPATPENLAELERVTARGEGKHDCRPTNYENFNPDRGDD